MMPQQIQPRGTGGNKSASRPKDKAKGRGTLMALGLLKVACYPLKGVVLKERPAMEAADHSGLCCQVIGNRWALSFRDASECAKYDFATV